MHAILALTRFIVILLVTLHYTSMDVQASASTALYEIEILVFKNNIPNLEGDELWIEQDVETKTKNREFIHPKKVAQQSAYLSKAVEKISSQKNYSIITHKRWSQDVNSKAASKIVRLSEPFGDNGSELSGDIIFYLSRFFHIDVNIKLKEPQKNFFATEGAPSFNTYKIDDNRRIKSKEIHYFDHPKFGMLVYVNPIKTSTH